MSRLIREEAKRLGLSTVGFAKHDPKYTFAEFASDQLENVVVCIVEQDYEATQTLPSGRAERSAFRAYAELIGRVGPLAEFIQKKGYRARPEDFAGHTMVIHYGVEAGLGQLGLNGQLLTPQAGSRCRLALITTDAPVVHGEPTDYGIEALCDSCQACVRRCPVGAIPNSRGEHRGVTKAKIKTERCLPVVIQAHGCGVCMKVCPVQRYGLPAVIEEFTATGKILGTGTDELEGFTWPFDGKRYGPGDKPRAALEDAFQHPQHYYFDPNVFDGEESTAETGGVGVVVGAAVPASGSDAPAKPADEGEGMPLM
jgi:epoxyqueuosine reductase